MTEPQTLYEQNVRYWESLENIDTVEVVKREEKKKFPFLETVDVVKEEEKKPFRYTDYFMETNTYPGSPKIFQAPTILLQAMWFLFFITVSIAMTIYMQMLIIEFLVTIPVVTFVDLKYGPLPYPDVTICNVNPIKKSYINETSCHLQHIVGVNKSDMSQSCKEDVDFNQVFEYYQQKSSYFCKKDDEACHTFVNEEIKLFVQEKISIQEEIREGISKLNGSEKKEFGHHFKDLILKCKKNGGSCDLYHQFLSAEYGNCVTVYAHHERRDAIGSGPDKGMELILNLEAEEYIQHYSADVGYRVIIHERWTVPIPSTDGFIVSGGQETNIALRVVSSTRLGSASKNNCYDKDEFVDLYYRHYTEEACRSMCLGNKTMAICGCYPPDFVDVDDGMNNHHLLCSYKQSLCARIVEALFVRDVNSVKTCGFGGCPNPCKRVSYESRVTTNVWPSHAKVVALEEEVCKKSNETSAKCNNDNHEKEERRRSFAKLNVYFESMNYVHIREERKLTQLNVFSDAGGVMGLFLGVTLLSVFEFFEAIIIGIEKLIRTLIKYCKSSNMRSEVNVSPSRNSNSGTECVTPTKFVQYRER